MGLFSKAKNVYAMQKQARAIKKELKNIHIEAESDGIMVTISGEQEFLQISVSDAVWHDLHSKEYGKKKFEELLLKVLNKAVKKAQEIGSSKMKGVWDQLGGG